MTYLDTNFKSKRRAQEWLRAGNISRVWMPGPFTPPKEGEVTVQGPWPPERARWMGRALVEGGRVKRIR